MLAQFQSLYPNGNIISELVQIFQGKYIVRVSVQIEGVTRATGMAAAETVEVAEDNARNRALIVLGIGNTPTATEVFSVTPIASTPQVNPTINTGDVAKTGDAVSSREIADPTPKTLSIQPEKIPPTIDLPSTSDHNNHSPDLTQPFTLPVTPDTQLEIPTENTGAYTEYQPSLGITASNVTPFTPRNYSSSEDLDSPATTRKKKKSAPVDLSDAIAKTDVELQRLGWTPEQGREHLIKTYGKRGRTLLTEDELYGFLKYLESQPTPIDPLTGF